MKTILFFLAAALVSVNAIAGDNSRKAIPAAQKTMRHVDTQGNLIATSRYISDVELPNRVVAQLLKKCPDQDIVSIREFESDGAKSYVVILQDAKGYSVVSADGTAFRTIQTLTK
ncbi:hypothetical protein ACWKWU_06765 [Chitinophaga lutea]